MAGVQVSSGRSPQRESYCRAGGVPPEKGEKLIDDPLKRALLQRDLWLVFNWLEGRHDEFAEPPLDAKAARAAQERLRRPLAAVIGRLALSPKQIRELPDNYAAAVASGRFARRFNGVLIAGTLAS
jgi:hypothetical protein